MSRPPFASTTNISDEIIVIKQYQSLINKLISLKQENLVLEELNKFSGRLSGHDRNIIRNEVARLSSETEESADNSAFAEFPLLKFKHFGIPMLLDRVGKEILLRETKRFHNRYTVGVFESVMNPEHYQSILKKEQQKKIVKAFSVESQSFDDIDFGVDLAIRPNFTIFSLTFDKGKKQVIASLSFRGMVVESKRPPAYDSEQRIFVFTLPNVTGLTNKTTDITYELEDSSFNKETSVFESVFSLTADTPKKFIDRLTKYVENSVNQFPLQRELEIERVMQNLERDRILEYSPWIPLFMGYKLGTLYPLFELMTVTNTEYNKHYSNLKDLPTKDIFHNLIKELDIYKESFLLKGVIENKGQEVYVAATLRQLESSGLIKQFIERATQSDKFRVIQYRLEAIQAEHKSVAFDIHDIIASEYSQLSDITHVLFCKDVTDWIGKLKITSPAPLKPFPKSIIDDLSRWPLTAVMEDQADRRTEARYLMNTPAKIKTGLFKQHDAILNDLSAQGLKLTLVKPDKVQFDDTVNVSVKALKLSSQTYNIVYYNQASGVLHLKLTEQLVQTEGRKLRGLFRNNSNYFNQRDLSERQRNIYRFLWELCIRNMPCASLLVTDNRITIERLKTVYVKKDNIDLQPFSAIGNEVPLHGFLANKDAIGPKSNLLEEMLRNNRRDAYVIHLVRSNGKQIVFIKEQDFLFGKIRNQISEHVAQNSVEPYITHICSICCTDSSTTLTSKRLAQISKIDLNIYKKINALQKGYTHVLHITNLSVIHSVLLKFGIYPELELTEKQTNLADPS